ncbi:MAG: glycosyltransferase [Vicinamibacterales bacterium]
MHFLGRVHEKKGVQVLLRALEAPALAGHTFAVVIAGPVDEAFRPALDRLRAAASSPERLVFTGPVAGARKAALFAHAAAFVLPSASEGLPMAALEALASGCPVVLTAACGLPEVTEAGAGLEVAAQPADVAAALARLLGDERLRQEMGRRGRRLAAERFGREAAAERMLALCREVARQPA